MGAASFDDETNVRVLLAMNGLAPSDSELVQLVEAYGELKIALDALHVVPEARYEALALTFEPRARFAEWAYGGGLTTMSSIEGAGGQEILR